MAATLVQSSGARSGNGTSQSWTWATAPTVGNVIIVKAVGWASPTGPTASCADAASNSYTQRTNALSTGSGATTTRGAIFDCVIASSPSSTTITWSISADHSVVFEEWSGLDTASLSDQVATPALSGLISGSGAQTLTVGPTATLAQADELVQTLLGAATGLAASNIATPSGYTGGVFEQNSPSFIGMGSAYKTVAATTAVDATWPFDVAGGAGQTAVALLATYRIASPPPTITGQPTDQTVNNGATATFSVTATGATSYQWKKNGTNVSGGSGGTTASYTTPAVSYSDQGAQYTCDCINGGGTTTSSAVTLRVAWNLSGTGPRAYPSLGHPFGAGTVGSWLRGANAGGPPSHGTTGALSADFATVSGTAAHSTLHSTSGALGSQAATLSGTATHLTLHTTTGILSAQASTITGSAAHQHATTGNLSAQAAALAGAANHATLHATSGALSSQAASITGAAQRQHVTTGALSAQNAQINGAAVHATLHATTGALTAQPAAVTGAAAHEHAVTGALSAQAASVAGSSDHVIPGTTHDTTGALAAQNAALSGAADHLTLHATTGSLAAQSAAVSGVAVHPHVGSGALVAQGSVLAGAAAHEHAALGALSAQAAALTGDAETIAPGGPHLTTGALTAQVAVVSGAAQHTSANGEDLTDAKFQGPSHNTRIRWLRKCEEEATEPQLPEPATEEPQPVAPKAPPRSTGLGEIAPPPVASVAVPEIRVPELKVVPPAKAAAPAPAPVEAAPAAVVGTASAAPVTVPAPAGPPPVVAQDLAKLEREMTAFVEGAVAGLTKQVAALDKMLQAKASELAAAQREIADLKRREVNRQRAEALARKVAEDDE